MERRGPGVDVGALVDGVNRALPGSSPAQRAALLVELTRAVYDYVKFREPEGGGLDGREGFERAGLGRVVDAAEYHLAVVRRSWLREGPAEDLD